MNPKKISQRSRIVNPHQSKYLADTSIQLERFILLLDILEHKINSLDLGDKVKHLESLDEFFAKTNEHLAAIDALNEKVPHFENETETIEIADDFSEDRTETYPKEADILEIEGLLEKSHYPKEILDYAKKELEQLNSATYRSSERYKQFQYLRTLLSLPWTQIQKESLDIKKAKAILDKNHYGMAKAKDRILEYLAVRQNSQGKSRQPILCLVGPPGVGKSSIGKSIAEAMGRKFIRFSVGGLDDETVIKGVHRSYSGSKPGRIIEIMKEAGVKNPVIMIDEIDKLGISRRGDPAAALLEVLDPELNQSFVDHYIEKPYDLSEVFFITTANSLSVSGPLLDRMEVIEMPGYSLEEKLEIVKQYLIPKRLLETGLQSEDIRFTDEALKDVIEGYTAEAGIRRLDRSIETIMRKTIRKKMEGEPFMRLITPESVRMYLGQPKIIHSKTPAKDETGIAYGLAVSQVYSCVTPIEAVLHAGKGMLKFTGNVGKVMRESAEAALSFIKSRASVFNIPDDFFENKDIHIHAPEAAVSKEGPSAGLAIATALASAVLGIPVRHDVTMTGEINLRGQVLAIGGVCEKITAAHREGKTTVILPRSNDKDFDDVPSSILERIKIVLADNLDDVLREALTEDPFKERNFVGNKTALILYQ